MIGCGVDETAATAAAAVAAAAAADKYELCVLLVV